MGVVFLVLVILLAGTSLIARIDSIVSRRKVDNFIHTDDDDSRNTANVPDPDVVAAISVALALSEKFIPVSGSQAKISHSSGSGISEWVAAGRRRAMEGGVRVRN